MTAAGFVAAAAVTPPLSVRWGVRRLVVVAFGASAFFQLLPGAIFSQLPLLVAGFLLGVTAQSIKLCVDTLVQAHVDDEFKGRVFVLYDMIFNVALVVAAVIGAVILPANGVSVPIIVGLAVAYALLGVWFALVSRNLLDGRGHRVPPRRDADRGARLRLLTPSRARSRLRGCCSTRGVASTAHAESVRHSRVMYPPRSRTWGVRLARVRTRGRPTRCGGLPRPARDPAGPRRSGAPAGTGTPRRPRDRARCPGSP